MQRLLEVIGWVGSFLIVLSVMQARVLRFRWMNLAGSVIATAYNAIIGIWPFTAMNAAIAAISGYWLVRLYREAAHLGMYRVLEVEPREAYLQHFLAIHASDIEEHAPNFTAADAGPEQRRCFMVVRGDEAVGVVIMAMVGEAEGRIELDWVKPRFRDFTPGRFVYQVSDALPKAGIRSVFLTPDEASDLRYLERAGFREDGDLWRLTLDAAV